MVVLKKTVASIKSTFSKMVDDLYIIVDRERGLYDKASAEATRAEKEMDAAVKFIESLNKLL